jgi:peptidoglycan/LPS O-acetylase OafA/YrhL
MTTPGCLVQPETRSATTKHIPALDGFRGFAALIVVIYHAIRYADLAPWSMLGSTTGAQVVVRFVIRYFLWFGYSGVELFFLISGFCLFYPHFCGKRFDVGSYVIRRFMRIYPPYLAALALSIAVAAAGAPLIRLVFPQVLDKIDMRNVIEGLTFSSDRYNQAFWTMVIEARWYFVVPVLILLWKRSPRLMYAGIPIVFIVLVVVGTLLPMSQLFPLARYLPLFLMGVFLAEITASGRAQVRQRETVIIASIVLAVGFLAVVLITPGTPGWSASLKQSWPFGVLYLGLFALALFAERVRRIFEWAPLIRLGEVSYSLYLSHVVVLYLAAGLFIGKLSLSGVALFVAQMTISVPVCILVGYLFYFAVEKPTMSIRLNLSTYGRASSTLARNSLN